MALLPDAAAFLEAVDIFPAIFVKRINEHRGAHDEARLGLVQTGFELIQHFLFDDIALLDVDLVEQRQVEAAVIVPRAAQKSEQQDRQDSDFVHLAQKFAVRRGATPKVARITAPPDFLNDI